MSTPVGRREWKQRLLGALLLQPVRGQVFAT